MVASQALLLLEMSKHSIKRIVIVVIALLPTSVSGQTLDDLVEWLPDLVLEETEDTYVGVVALRADPRGGWIAWDSQAHQVRLYDPSGALRGYFGGEGSGPGEFRRLISATRLEDHRLVALDSRGRLSVWDAAGSAVELDFDSGIRRPFGMVAGVGDTVIVSGLTFSDDRTLSTTLLHRVSVAEQASIGPAFALPAIPDHTRLIGTIQSAGPTKSREGVAVGIAILDSLWVIPTEAEGTVRRLPIPADLIAGLREERPPLEEMSDMRAWIADNAFLGNAFQRNDGGWLIHVWSFDTEPWSGLLALDPEGRVEWEVPGVPQLVWYAPESERLYFWDPNGFEPARIRVATLR